MDSFNNIDKAHPKDTCKNFILPWIECKRSLGRLELSLIAIRVGNDLQVVLHGGDAHIGATAVAKPDEDSRIITCSGHREDKMALEVANIMADGLECTICASVGIHYNNILKDEIELLNKMASESAHEAVEKLKNIHTKTVNKKTDAK